MRGLQGILKNLLLAFALISIGFALGKHSVSLVDTAEEDKQGEGEQVFVYYLHSSFRCVSCNQIEQMTFDLLQREYAEEIAEEKMIWREADFQENTKLAEQFEILASCVVVAKALNGEILDYQRLDEVWRLLEKPTEFDTYIREAIEAYLKEAL